MARECCPAVILAFLPALYWYQKKGACDVVAILLNIFCGPCAIIYVLMKLEGFDCCRAVACVYLPPLGLYLTTKKCDGDFWCCLLLTVFCGGCGVIFCLMKV